MAVEAIWERSCSRNPPPKEWDRFLIRATADALRTMLDWVADESVPGAYGWTIKYNNTGLQNDYIVAFSDPDAGRCLQAAVALMAEYIETSAISLIEKNESIEFTRVALFHPYGTRREILTTEALLTQIAGDLLGDEFLGYFAAHSEPRTLQRLDGNSVGRQLETMFWFSHPSTAFEFKVRFG